MPLVTIAVASYALGLGLGRAGVPIGAALAVALLAVAAAIARRPRLTGCAMVCALGIVVARAAPRESAAGSASPFAAWREQAGRDIDRLFGDDAGVVRALLIADERELAADLRERYARAGLVHVLSISGLHVGIISGAVLVVLRALRLALPLARWGAVLVTLLYVLAIGAPAPAVRSGTMFAATTASWALQRPTSPWATLALGACVPLFTDPGAVADLGYQLSVAGFAALIAAGAWARRSWPARLGGGWRRVATELAISVLATAVTAPLVAWHFGRVSVIAPLANLLAAPLVAVMQPALFLAMIIAPWAGPAQVVADAARVLVAALDGVAALAAAVPGASIAVQSALATALLAGMTALGLCAAAASRAWAFRGMVISGAAFAGMVWWPTIPTGPRGMEVHMIDVGQGDAIAVRTPRGRWVVVDAGGGRGGHDAGRRVVVPYVSRLGGDVAMLVFSHPHDDHVGGAAALIARLRPAEVRDAAFAGTSPAYREALLATRAAGIPWYRVHPRDSMRVDGVTFTFLAPDSAWTAGLRDPNLASAIVRARFGTVRVLLTGDAEAPEEAWLLEHARDDVRADVLKVAHHGSATSSGAPFLDAVRPAIALVSVGPGNRYGHPSPGVIASLEARGVAVLRTDRNGSVVVATDSAGTTLTARAVSGSSLFPVRARP